MPSSSLLSPWRWQSILLRSLRSPFHGSVLETTTPMFSIPIAPQPTPPRPRRFSHTSCTSLAVPPRCTPLTFEGVPTFNNTQWFGYWSSPLSYLQGIGMKMSSANQLSIVIINRSNGTVSGHPHRCTRIPDSLTGDI